MAVWAVDEPHLANYLLPRDCPRVTFNASAATTDADRRRFNIGQTGRVVIIERSWVDVVTRCVLWVYELPATTFTLWDECAGYWISRQSIQPARVAKVANLLDAMSRHGAEVRVVDRLWDIHDAVAASTLEFSIIRMRNLPR